MACTKPRSLAASGGQYIMFSTFIVIQIQIMNMEIFGYLILGQQGLELRDEGSRYLFHQRLSPLLNDRAPMALEPPGSRAPAIRRSV